VPELKKIHRIALIGPESTGKTSLCKWMSNKFGVEFLSEYSREYLNKLDKPFHGSDIIKIYTRQFEFEKDLLSRSKNILFVDTEFINAKIWYKHHTGNEDPWFDNMIMKHPYDLYLLTKPDIPWEPDNLRANPGKSDYFFKLYEEQLVHFGFNYRIIEGEGHVRNQNAEQIVKDYLKKY